MKVAVFDTYVTKKNGGIMHFDILIEDAIKYDVSKVFEYGAEYLAQKGQNGQRLSTDECQFCHIEHAPLAIIESIRDKGYHIIEMQGC